jgi:AraC-like DNA-binding protein
VTLRLSRTLPNRYEGALLTHARTSVGPLTIDEVYVAGHLDARPDPLNKVMAVLPASGRVVGTCGGLTSEAEAGDVALLSQPHLEYRAQSDDLHVTAVLLDPTMVAGVATGLPSSQAGLPIRFSSMVPLHAEAARLFKQTVAYVKDTVLRDDTSATPLVVGQAGRLLAAMTLATFPNSVAASAAPYDRTDYKPVLLRRAIEYMDANVAEDIALADIAEAVHVTPRAVQYMFRRHLETTPLQYLRRLRLHYAQQDLLAGDRHDDTVAEIAARWGFAHTGRFAVLYRQTYGQSPHIALRG